MKIPEPVYSLLNQRVTTEWSDWLAYESLAAYADDVQLKGMAHWFHIQADEEMGHGNKVMQHILDRNQPVTFGAIPAPPPRPSSPLNAFEVTLKLQRFATQDVLNITSAAAKANDHTTYSFMQFFVDDQVQGEAQVIDILKQFEYVGSSLFLLDKKLGKR